MSPRGKERLLFVVALACALGGFLFGTLHTYVPLGTRDHELVFRAESPILRAPSVRRSVMARVAAEEGYADVEVRDRELRVVVSEGYASTVRWLVTWQGGFRAYRVDAAFDLPPTTRPDLTVEGPDASGGRRYTGTAGALVSAFGQAKLEGDHAVVFAHVEGTPLYRTLPYVTKVLYETKGLRSVTVSDDGQGVLFRVAPEVSDVLGGLARRDALLLMAGSSIAALDPQVRPGLVLASAGHDLRAYRRARKTASLLGTTDLPPLELTTDHKLPPDYGLAALHFALPLLIASAWFAIVRRFDRAAPEPWWLVLTTGALAMAMSPLVFLLRSPLHGTSWGDTTLVDHAGRIEAFPATLLAFILEAGAVEELVKLLPVLLLARWRREFDEPVDGIIYTSASAIGFSCVEEFGYMLHGRLHASLLLMRATCTPPGHIFWSAIMGYALGKGIGRGARGVPGVVLGWALAACGHGLYDALTTFRELRGLAQLFEIVLMIVFAFLVRRALRGSAVAARPSADAQITRVGGWGRFAALTLLFVLLVSSLRAFGFAEEGTMRTVEFAFVALALASMVGVTALGMVGAVPLDVVLDAAGVTFSGITLRWAAVRAVDDVVLRGSLLRRHQVVVESGEGTLRIAPLDARRAEALAGAIGERLSERGVAPS